MAKQETAAGPMPGFRDMLAEQMLPRQQMLDTIRGVYERHGFVPLDTPAVERLETLTGKYGDEGESLMYKFQDHGGRPIALRYDLTVPLARVVGQHRAELTLPYKRYQVGSVWRGESPQKGRYREFLQFDADTVGTTSPIADAEIVAMMSDAMTALGAEAVVHVNNRLLLDALVAASGVTDEKDVRYMVTTIDKLPKIGLENVVLTVKDIGGKKASELVEKFLTVEGSVQERLQEIGNILGKSEAAEKGIANLSQVFTILQEAGFGEDKVVLDQSIARGLNYYTGVIYETVLNDLPGIGSVCSGGRYDNLVEALGGPSLPAVGTSIGVDRLFEGLKQLGKLDVVHTKSVVMIANFDNQDASHYMKLATQLRRAGIATEVHYDPDKLGKQLAFADKRGIPYVVLMGEDELKRGVVKVKNILTREQTECTEQELIDMLTGGTK